MHSLIHYLVGTYDLSPAQSGKLWSLAGLDRAPLHWQRLVLNALGITAALFLGAGLIFWIAANWQSQTRQFKFLLLQVAVALPLLGAVFAPRARGPFVLLLVLAIGGLLAFVGQTYQTGADPWQLFAVWGLLALFCIAALRHDFGFCGLTAIWATGISLWGGGSILSAEVLWRGNSFRTSLTTILLYMALAAVVLGLARLVGASSVRWTTRLLCLVCCAAWVAVGVYSLWGNRQMETFILCVLLVAGLGALIWRRKPLDLSALSIVVLSLNVFLLGLVVRGVINERGDFISGFFLVGLIASVSVGISGAWLYKLQQRGAAR